MLLCMWFPSLILLFSISLPMAFTKLAKIVQSYCAIPELGKKRVTLEIQGRDTDKAFSQRCPTTSIWRDRYKSLRFWLLQIHSSINEITCQIWRKFLLFWSRYLCGYSGLHFHLVWGGIPSTLVDRPGPCRKECTITNIHNWLPGFLWRR